MSDAASVALIILIAFQLVLLVALSVVAVIASVSIVEATALTRRSLRHHRRTVEKASARFESAVEEKVVNPITQFERGAAWAERLATDVARALSQRFDRGR
jgi:hypothetical protein